MANTKQKSFKKVLQTSGKRNRHLLARLSKDKRKAVQLTQEQTAVISDLQCQCDEIRTYIDNLDDLESNLRMDIKRANKLGLKFAKVSFDTGTIDTAVTSVEDRAEELDELDNLFYERLNAKGEIAPKRKAK